MRRWDFPMDRWSFHDGTDRYAYEPGYSFFHRALFAFDKVHEAAINIPLQ